MKRCNKCGETKNLQDFANHKNRYDGKQPYCKACSYAMRTQWAANNPTKIQTNRLWSIYKIRQDQYDKMLSDQNNACMICKIEFSKRPHVDHNHRCCPGRNSCGKCVRGLLCGSCNVMLGMYETLLDHPGFIEYINKYSLSG